MIRGIFIICLLTGISIRAMQQESLEGDKVSTEDSKQIILPIDKFIIENLKIEYMNNVKERIKYAALLSFGRHAGNSKKDNFNHVVPSKQHFKEKKKVS